VTVGDVQLVEHLERLRQTFNQLAVAHRPQAVAHAVVGGYVHLGLAARDDLGHGVDLRKVAVGKKYRTGLGIERVDLAHAVVFLVRTREFVAADTAGLIGRDRGGGDQTHLRVRPHHQAVEVVVRFGVARQHARLQQAVEVLPRLGIHRGIVRVGAGGEVDFGLGNMQETPGLAGRPHARLLARQHVIGWRDDIGGPRRRRAQAGKGTNQGHEALLNSHEKAHIQNQARRRVKRFMRLGDLRVAV